MATIAVQLGDALRDRYRLERELGLGGMATVYLARDLKHDRAVALKVLRPELTLVLGAGRFLGEIRVTAGLQHPHILPLIDSGSAGAFLYYVMPYVEGESLRQRLTRVGQLPLEETLALTRAVAAALDYAHAQGVVHRDIKPENILLSHGEPMVADFGIALARSPADRFATASDFAAALEKGAAERTELRPLTPGHSSRIRLALVGALAVAGAYGV